LLPPPVHKGKVSWIEISMREVATISPSSEKYLEQWRSAGYGLETCIVRGPGFWQTVEIEDAPELLSATMEALKTWP
jgi:hypothetical protein